MHDTCSYCKEMEINKNVLQAISIEGIVRFIIEDCNWHQCMYYIAHVLLYMSSIMESMS